MFYFNQNGKLQFQNGYNFFYTFLNQIQRLKTL